VCTEILSKLLLKEIQSYTATHSVQNQHIFSCCQLYVSGKYGRHQADHKKGNKYMVRSGLRSQCLTYVLYKIFTYYLDNLGKEHGPISKAIF
jgi:hypothetical protein